MKETVLAPESQSLAMPDRSETESAAGETNVPVAVQPASPEKPKVKTFAERVDGSRI